MYILLYELGKDDYQVVENLICEILRCLEGGEASRYTGVDTVSIGQLLYHIMPDILVCTD